MRSYFTHTFKVDPTADLPSFLWSSAGQSGHPVLRTVRRLKISKIGFTIGEDGEIKTTFSAVGQSSQKTASAYDTGAVKFSGTKFNNFKPRLPRAAARPRRSSGRWRSRSTTNWTTACTASARAGGFRTCPRDRANRRQGDHRVQGHGAGADRQGDRHGRVQSGDRHQSRRQHAAQDHLRPSALQPHLAQIAGPKAITVDLDIKGYVGTTAGETGILFELTNLVEAY